MTQIYQVTLLMNFAAEGTRNTFYYDAGTGIPSDAEWQDVADEIRALIGTSIQSSMVNDWACYGINHRYVSTAGYPSFAKSFTSGAILGSNVQDYTATQVAMVCSVKGNTTKPSRARNYLGGFSEDALLNSVWQATPLANATAFITGMMNLNAAGTNPLNRVAVQWNSSHTAVVASNDISGGVIQISSYPGTLRSRRIGVGI